MEGGDLFINSSLVDSEPKRSDIHVFKIAANEIGGDKSANMVMLGAYLAKHPAVSLETIEKVMQKTMQGSKAKFIPMNLKAIEQGMEAVKAYSTIQ